MPETFFSVGPYRLTGDRHYDPETHLWVAPAADGRARCGLDPLGSETSGDIVAVSFEPAGTRVERGEAFGSLEAAKFVGPLVAPVTGTVLAHHEAVLANPALLNEDPLSHWLIEIELARPQEELSVLLTGEEAVRAWFERELRRFTSQGMIAR